MRHAGHLIGIVVAEQTVKAGVAIGMDPTFVACEVADGMFALAIDLPPEAPSFIMRVCGSGFHILRRQFGQARRARSPQIAQALGALLQAFGSPAMNAV